MFNLSVIYCLPILFGLVALDLSSLKINKERRFYRWDISIRVLDYFTIWPLWLYLSWGAG